MALPLLFTMACGDGIITPEGTPPATLFNVRGEASGALDADVTGQLRAALAWKVYSAELLECLDNVEVTEQLDLSNAADLEVVLRLESCLLYTEQGRRETSSVDIQSEFPANFNIPVDTLPDPSLLSGTDGARLGLADILVYTDDNGNGVYDSTPRGALSFVDPVHGTSLPVEVPADGILRRYSFIVYREGSVSPFWKLYRAIYGCGDPPAGFSTLTLTVNDEATEVTCVFDDSPLPVTLTPAANRLACAADPQAHTLNRAAEASWPAGGEGSCAGPEFAVEVLSVTTDLDSVCPSFRQYSLEGCSDITSEEACQATSWDDNSNIPGWWPCKDGFSSFSGFIESAEYATDAPDDFLFDFRWYNGVGELPLNELQFEFTLGVDDPTVVIGGAGFTLVDNDQNGVFNAGDVLRVREVGNLFTTASSGSFTVALTRNGEVLNFFNPYYYTAVEPPPQPPAVSSFASDAPAPVTDGVDDLTRVTHLGFDFEPFRFPFETLRAEIVVGEGDDAVTINLSAADGSIVFVDDREGDGVFAYNDAILLRDPTADLGGSIHPALLAERGNLVQVRVLTPFNGGYGVIADTFVRLE